MDERVMRLTFLSIRRRWREVARTCIAAFWAVFFVTAILIFEQNMFEWQVASNKDRFGDWFVMESNTRVQSEYLKYHPKLSNSATVLSAVKLYNENYDDADCYIGYMSPEFLKIGHIETVEGRLPEADNEVAMDWNTLVKNGISSPQVGQQITIRYYKNNSDSDGEQMSEEFVLVGILEDYTNVWYRSRYLPGALVTKEKYEAFGSNCLTTHIYQLVESERNGDYKAIYEEIRSGTNINPAYNSYVYDYKPWGTESVYNYMYVLVMVIGIAALTYQLLVYKNSRKKTYELMRKLGATKSQITFSTFVENVFMLLPSGVLGIVIAAVVGRLICAYVESQMGIGFYYISIEILAKGMLSVVIAVVVEEIASRLLAIRQILTPKKQTKSEALGKTMNVREEKQGKYPLGKNNIYRKISFRFTRANKIAQNIGVRVFSLGVCVVVVLCSLRIFDTYVAYRTTKDNIDLTGVAYVDAEYMMQLPYYVELDNNEDTIFKVFHLKDGSIDPKEYLVMLNQEEIDRFTESAVDNIYNPDKGAYTQWGSPAIDVGNDKVQVQLDMDFYRGLFYKEPKTNITKGFSEIVIKTIENVAGIESVTYGTYESQRTWTWEGMSLEKMGYDRLSAERTGAIAGTEPYASRDVFATQYINPTEELYNRLSKYIDPSMQDYEAFANGEQVVILLSDNPYGEYDDTLSAGKTINYKYYDFLTSNEEGIDIFAWQNALEKCIKDNSNKIDRNNWQEYLAELNRKSEIRLRLDMGTCVQTEAAAVVHMTEEVREELADILTSNSYYMAIASTNLAKKVCDSQNKIMAEYVGVEELEEDCKAKVVYNQLAVKYNLMSAFSATDNIISTYCAENDIEYTSYADINEQYRTDFINAVLQYGITIIAVIVINMLICAIVAQNRLETRRQRIELLLRLGAEKKDVCRIFMIEALRESLWCVITLPIILVIQYIVYKRNI